MGRCAAYGKGAWKLAGAHAKEKRSGGMRVSVHPTGRVDKQQYRAAAEFSSMTGCRTGSLRRLKIPPDQRHGLAGKAADVLLLDGRMEEAIQTGQQVEVARLGTVR